MSDHEERQALLKQLETLGVLVVTPERLRLLLEGAAVPSDDTGMSLLDLVGRKLSTRIVLEKFDKTDIATPGVEGLEPIETLVFDDGVLTEHHRSQDREGA